MNLSVIVKDARGRDCYEYNNQIITNKIEGAKPLELRHIIADALGQDKDGPFKPRLLIGVLDTLNNSGRIKDEGVKAELIAWVEKTEQLTPLVKARFFEVANGRQG